MPADMSECKEQFLRNLERFEKMTVHYDIVDVLSVLKDRVYIAKQKHPTFATDAFKACDVISSELEELYAAVDHESEDRQIDEAIDVAVTAIRFILGEYKERPLDRASA